MMTDDLITWTSVTNTVASRMKDLSLVHQLIPSRKLRRTTKALNIRIHKTAGIKSYAKYVEAKTAVLRNLSDDDDTDDSDRFSDEDYSIVYKNDQSLREYIKNTSLKSRDFFSGEEFDTDQDNTTIQPAKKKKKVTPVQRRQKPELKRKNTRSVNLGWQDVVKKKKGLSHSSSDQWSTNNTTSTVCNNSQENVSRVAEDDHAKKANRHDSPGKILKKNSAFSEKRTLNDPKKPTEEANLKLQARKCNIEEKVVKHSEDNRPEAVKNIKRNLNTVLEQFNGTQEGECSVINNLNETTFLNKTLHLSQANPISQSTPLTDKKLEKRHQEQQLICAASHPKDSGIDEDSVEESSEDGKHDIAESRKGEKCAIKESKKAKDGKRVIKKSTTDENGVTEESKGQGHCDIEEVKQEEICVTEESKDKTKHVIKQLNDKEKHVIEDSENDDKQDIRKSEKDEKRVVKKLKKSKKCVTEESEEQGKCDVGELKEEDTCVTEESNDKEKHVIKTSQDVDEHIIKESEESEKSVIEESQKYGECVVEASQESNEHAIKDSEDNGKDIVEESEKDEKCSTEESENDDDETVQAEEMCSTMCENVDETVLQSPNDNSMHNDSAVNTHAVHEITQKQKLHPIVTSTQIVKKRYRIISESESHHDFGDCTQSEGLDIRLSISPHEELLDQPEEGESGEDIISPHTEKRLNQLKRLNLVVDSDSSFSPDEEDEDKNFDNIRDESHKIPNKEESDNDCIEFHEKIDSFIKNALHADLDIQPCKKKRSRHTPENTSESVERTSSRVDSDNSQNKEHEENMEKQILHEVVGDLESNISILNDSLGGERPRNLEELMEDEKLSIDTTIPSFTMRNIYEDDDLYILEIPKTVDETELVGKRLVLTKKRLHLGQQKYKTSYRDVDVVTCVFGTGKSRKPFKTVNIKPMARVIMRKQAKDHMLIKSPSKSVSDAENCTKVQYKTGRPKAKRRHDAKHN